MTAASTVPTSTAGCRAPAAANASAAGDASAAAAARRTDGVQDFAATLVKGREAVLAGIAAAEEEGGVGTAFQSGAWLAALYADMAPAKGGEPWLVSLRAVACMGALDPQSGREASAGGLVLALPLVVRRRGALKVAEIADCGISDYGAPLLGPWAPGDRAGAAAVYEALQNTLDEIDFLSLEKMPLVIGNRVNPLTLHAKAQASRFNANTLEVPDTLEAALAARGKKHRKEYQRKLRRLEEMGEVVFARAQSVDVIDSAYRQLEIWQEQRHRSAGHDYFLDRPEVSHFYHRLLRDNVASEAASLYTLRVGGELCAVLLGIRHAGTFTILRIADGGDKWRHASPGRMMVLEAMRAERARGITSFDLGIGDYPFKQWIGCGSEPLVEVMIAQNWRALPRVWVVRARQRLRMNPRIRAIAQRIKGLGKSQQASG